MQLPMEYEGGIPTALQYFVIRPTNQASSGEPGFGAFWVNIHALDTRKALTPVKRVAWRATRELVRDSMVALFKDIAEWKGQVEK